MFSVTIYFCRRRLPVIMVKLRMAQHIGDAAKFVEQGRILNHTFCGQVSHGFIPIHNHPSVLLSGLPSRPSPAAGPCCTTTPFTLTNTHTKLVGLKRNNLKSFDPSTMTRTCCSCVSPRMSTFSIFRRSPYAC